MFGKAGTYNSLPLVTTIDNIVGGVPKHSVVLNGFSRKEVITRSSVKTANYKLLRRLNGLPINNYNVSLTRNTCNSGSWYYDGGGNPANAFTETGDLDFLSDGDISAGLLKINPVNTSTVLAMASSRVLASVKDMSFNAAQALAERGQTTRLLVKTISRAADFLIAIRKGNFTRAQRLLREAGIPVKKNPKLLGDVVDVTDHKKFSAVWLEYVYGWRPLLEDIYGAAELLAKQHLKNDPMKVTGTAKLTNRGSNGSYAPEGNVICPYEWESTVKAKITVQYAMNNDVVRVLSRTGISNPALLAWELLPFSFVADWFIPVGQYLGNIDATCGLTFVSGYQNVRSDSYSRCQMTKYGNYRVVPGGKQEDKQSFTRTKITSFPSNTFPTFKNPISTTHAANAIALVSQLYKGR